MQEKSNNQPDKNTEDKSWKRATFGVPYPTSEYDLPSSDSAPSEPIVEEKKIKTKPGRSFRKLSFKKCSLFVRENQAAINVLSVTFENCVFDSCFLGVKFAGVSFRNCTFTKCSFDSATFEDCIFDEKCTFKTCSAGHAQFIRTLIDPAKFLDNISFMKDNYQEMRKKTDDKETADVNDGASSSDDRKKKDDKEKEASGIFDREKMWLARRVYASNADARHEQWSDAGLIKFRELELKVGREEEKCLLKKCWRYVPYYIMRLSLSAYAMVGLAVFGVAIAWLLIWLSDSCYQNNEIRGFGGYLVAAASVFLGFGYTNLGKAGWGLLPAVFGLFWFAMLIPLVIRKFSR